MVPRQTPLAPIIAANDPLRRIAAWLFLCAGLIFIMALIGAITRLTESGLSITEWKPITGVLFPLNDTTWHQEFDRYRSTPEYLHKNLGMTLDEFKTIYFWEWIHRLWGRLIGLFFALPLLYFWMAGHLSSRLKWALLGLLALGGLQGFVGWFMVQSGLVDRPSVSHYRLALHLSMALLLYSLLIALARSLVIGPVPAFRVTAGLWAHGVAAMILVVLTIVWGALVAGLDAGMIYNEFPTMGSGRLMPVEMWAQNPWWINLFENHAAVQFVHRGLAVITMVIVGALAVRMIIRGRAMWAYPALGVVVILQVGLGILTLLSQVHIGLATAHQAGAMILLGLMVVALQDLWLMGRANPTSRG